MENKFEHIDDIIAKYLAGEATAEEEALLTEWRNESPENDNEFKQFGKLFEAGASLRDVIPVDTDAAWIKLKKSISQKHENGKIIPIQQKSNRLTFIRIAAAVLIFAGLGMLAFFMTLPSEDNLAEIHSTEKVKKEILPDGSTITLNKNTTLAYSVDHFSKKRIVKLKGEAFFDVKHDESNPFVVEAADLKIEDVGTSFNVKAKESSDVIIISVVSGEVKVTTVSDQMLSLNAGEEATYNITTKVIGKKEVIKENISAYSDKVFVFENAELGTVINVLNDVYDVQLGLANMDLKSCRITVTFEDEPIDDIAFVIAETLGLEIKKENEQIVFNGKSCK